MSFGSQFTLFRLPQFPSAPVPLVAPLFADYDFREAGNVFYRVTQEEGILSKARELIGVDGYFPTSCVVVTWSEARLFSRSSGLTAS